MDFRSQLSAFQSGGGGGSNSSGGGGGGGNQRRGYNNNNNRGSSPHRPQGGRAYHHGGDRDNNRDSRGDSYYGRGGGGRGDNRSDGYDRNNNNSTNRGRPRDWNQQGERGGPPNQRRRFHSPDRDGLGELRRYEYRIPKGFPPPPTPDEKKRKAKHLALLVITIDDLPYEHIWKTWMEDLTAKKDDYYISVVCHAKYPQKVQSEWLKQRLLVFSPKLGRGNSFLDPEFRSRKPEWGSVEITRAMLDLLQDATKIGSDHQKDMRFSANRYVTRRPPSASSSDDKESSSSSTIPPVDQFLFVSETCLPVTTAKEFFAKVQDTTVSWVNARHRREEGTPKNKYEDDQFAGINRRIPGQYRWKADQWVLLCRDHAKQILGMDRPHKPAKHQIWNSFREINASDEMYFPTALALLGLLRYAGDGEDTQRSRAITTNTDDKSSTSRSDQRGGGGRGYNNSSGSNSKKDEKDSAKDDKKDDEPKIEVVLKKPVTYTDWTEGMRNPATFIKGISDFTRVAKLAREKGCLVARKFAPFITVPGMTPEEQKITGQISSEEWKQAVEAMKAKDEEENPPAPEEEDEEGEAADDDGAEGDQKEATTTTKDDENDEDSDSGEEEGVESFLGIGKALNRKQDESEEEEDDDEEEETELE